MTNRVVITGYGVVSAIGNSPEEFWNNLKAGKTGIGPITHFDAEATGISVAAEVKEFPFDKYFQKKDARRMDTFSLYAVYAALDAMEMSGITEENTNFDRLGCIMASGIGGLEQSQKNSQAIVAKGPRKGVAPLYVPLAIANMATGNVALRTGARGVSRAEVTACAAGANSIGSAFREIKHGYADAMIAGGAEAAICELGIAGFANLTALTKETDPEKACIPFDKNRSGFVMGEGSGVLILESLEHAQARGANILAEIVGYGNTNDAFHMTTPSGVGAENAIKLALEEAGASPADVDYVNAHGTSTHANEETESKAIHNVIGDKAYVSSTKALHGHALGATGAIEAVATVQALLNPYAPVNAGTTELDEGMTINVVLGEGKPADINLALSQDFGFGGHNAVLAFKKWTGE